MNNKVLAIISAAATIGTGLHAITVDGWAKAVIFFISACCLLVSMGAYSKL